MFFEETVINGVLYWRNAPNGKWSAFTLEELTSKLIDERDKSERLKGQLAPHGFYP